MPHLLGMGHFLCFDCGDGGNVGAPPTTCSPTVNRLLYTRLTVDGQPCITMDRQLTAFAMRRKELKLSQKEIADALGLREQSVGTWERGVHSPKLYPWQTAVLCDLLKCSLKELAEMFPHPSQRV